MSRLEESIELLLHASRECTESDNASDPCFKSLYNYKQLIKELYNEKAERAEELEFQLDSLREKRTWDRKRMKKFWDENQCYRQALEEMQKDASSYMGNSAARRLYDISSKALKEDE